MWSEGFEPTWNALGNQLQNELGLVERATEGRDNRKEPAWHLTQERSSLESGFPTEGSS